MRKILTRTVSDIVSLISYNRVRLGLRLLMYHAVGTRIKEDTLGIYSVNPKLFEQHIKSLTEYRYACKVGLTSGDYKGEELKIAVTFDDGYSDNLYTAAPVLLKYNIPFTVFAVASFIKSNSPEYMNASELRELSEYPGVTIGSHGDSHKPLAMCDDNELQAELLNSRRYLEDVIGKPVNAISYPHGSVDMRVRDFAEKAGYVTGCCSYPGINKPDRDPLMFCRTAILSEDSVRLFMQKLNGHWDWYRWRYRDPAATS